MFITILLVHQICCSTLFWIFPSQQCLLKQYQVFYAFWLADALPFVHGMCIKYWLIWESCWDCLASCLIKKLRTIVLFSVECCWTWPQARYGSCTERIDSVFFLQGGKEKMKDHEKTAVGPHMLLLLQHMKQLKTSLCSAAKAANGFIPQPETSVNGAGKSISDLQIPAGLELSGGLEEDCLPGASVSEDESVLQQLVKEKVISELENKLHVFENIVAVLNKEVETSNLEITAFRRQSELDQNIIRGLEMKVNSYDKHCLCACSTGCKYLHISGRGGVEIRTRMGTGVWTVKCQVLDTSAGSFCYFVWIFKWRSLTFVI